ncbi:glyoxylate reductase [Acetobacteraceae bacterium H6797]|nr:glyoxylate reductase [Acetobacteraceae bacterium H6797]
MPSLPRVLFYPVLQGVRLPRIAEMGELRELPGGPSTIGTLSEAERGAIEILVTNAGLGCDASVIAQLPALRRVISTGAGLDKHDQAAMAARGITLRPIGEAVTDDVADLTLALTLMTARSLVRADAFARSEWKTKRWAPGRSLVGATMGIAGISGRIGKAIAARAEAFKMKVVGLHRASAEGLGYELLPDLKALAAVSDFLVLALPGGAGMKHLIGKAELEALGAEGTLINIGRGTLVDTEALIEALEKGVIAAAGLDVVEGEPGVPERLAALPNVVLTPHIGAATWGARTRGAAIAEGEVLAALGVTEPV